MKPIIKWAGGKTALLNTLTKSLPPSFSNYYEPFAGGCALTLAVAPNSAYINDINPMLINVYKQLKDYPDEFIERLKDIYSEPISGKYYNKMRTEFNVCLANEKYDLNTAAIFIYLNKHCYNGLYRLNNLGFYNVPWNHMLSPKDIDEPNLRAVSNYLRENNVRFSSVDFEEACKSVRANDFVYFDSPYIPFENKKCFCDYSVDGFTMKDHERLAELFKYLDSVGAKLMLSNHNTNVVHTLYASFNIQPVDVRHSINCDGANRKAKEVIITNY